MLTSRGTMLGIVGDFLKCTRYSYSVQELAAQWKSKAQGHLPLPVSPGCPFSKDRLNGPFYVRGLLALAGPRALMAVLWPTLLRADFTSESSYATAVQGSAESMHASCPMPYTEFPLVVVGRQSLRTSRKMPLCTTPVPSQLLLARIWGT